MRRFRRRSAIGFAVLLAASAIALLIACASYRIWSPTEWRVYREMDRECHPAWRDFHFRRVRSGDPVEEVTSRTRPDRIEHFGNRTELHYTAFAIVSLIPVFPARLKALPPGRPCPRP